MTVTRASAPGVVTPEAVRLEFQAASVGTRTLAILIDLAIQLFLILVVLIAVGFAIGAGERFGLPSWVGVTIILLAVFAVLWGYPTALETIFGRTPGKAALGLRVVTREGAPVTFRHAAVRAALGLVDFYLTVGGVAVLSVLLSRREQRLGDLVAGTLVLRERSATPAPRPVLFTVPPGLEWFASTLDPAVLDARGYQAVRTFLLRAGQLSPAVRHAVARRIADPIVARLGRQPPPDLTPELFLVCLAARYQQR
jgi:uncharacterized RDD family membrane protein YckC